MHNETLFPRKCVKKKERKEYRCSEFISSFIFPLETKRWHINSNAALGTRATIHVASSASADCTLKRVGFAFDATEMFAGFPLNAVR